jgi:hypothetical protein
MSSRPAAAEIDIGHLILEIRPDPRKRFGVHLPGNAEAFLGWPVTAEALVGPARDRRRLFRQCRLLQRAACGT